ncbi:poly-gamma-glutamate hydrolase family protein [Streptomyces sp. NPDC049577]|uniref:poly-gamma-glutamate hydrolase family protein n=1 Tax=Streptomyces sp. NPDC049577 TaxID=3155153 RepID=UPI00341B4EDF
MSPTSRRTFLTAAGTAAAVPLLGLPGTARAAGRTVSADEGDGDHYPSNTALYADTSLVEGKDYGRRYRRHAVTDDDLAGRAGFVRTTILALHGGGIETGTSELCLAVAGYHPADLTVTPAGGPVYDYWMFEALRATDNGDLHVTATHCDDGVARSLCAGSLNAVSLHGCTASQAGLESTAQAVLVGGRNAAFRRLLLEEFAVAGIRAVDASAHPTLGGVDPDNIANRTLLGMGAQLETTTALRAAMFTDNTRAGRKTSTTPLFWSFTNAVRAATGRLEATQVIA